MKNKIGIFAFLFVVITLLPLGTVFAAKPVEMSAILYCEAEIIDSWIAGNNEFSIRELDCVFTGDILGDVERFVTVRVNQKSNSANGPVIPWFVGNVQQVLFVTNAEVTVGDDVAIGSFVIKAYRQIGNVKWRIVSSDVTVDAEPAILHGNGYVMINYIQMTSPTTYIMENTFAGQISLS